VREAAPPSETVTPASGALIVSATRPEIVKVSSVAVKSPV
jgi:hypothetical protein